MTAEINLENLKKRAVEALADSLETAEKSNSDYRSGLYYGQFLAYASIFNKLMPTENQTTSEQFRIEAEKIKNERLKNKRI